MAAPKEPQRLKPSSPWNIHYADDSCRMVRSFGEGDDQVILIADRFEPDDALEISFIGKRFPTGPYGGRAQLRFGPREAEQERGFYTMTMDDSTPAIMLRGDVRLAPPGKAEMAAYERASGMKRYGFEWSKVAPEQEAAATFIEVRNAAHAPFLLETGSLGAPMKALRQCADDLPTLWGIDVAKHAGLSRKPIPKTSPRGWIGYPPKMAEQGRSAVVHYRLDVDATGAPTDCHIQQSTRPEEFDRAVCRGIMRWATFEPALDAEGNPVASYYVSAVYFRIS